MKKVNIILSTYNGDHYLRPLLDSIYAQTYGNISLYVRDDGSRDSTVKILREYQQREEGGKRLILMNEAIGDWSNRGAHQSYRLLMEHLPDADYYVFCDQDDVWEADKVERAVTHMEKYPSRIPVLYTHNYFICDGDLNVTDTLPPRHSYTPEEMSQIHLNSVIMAGTWAGVGMAQAFNHTLKQLTFDSGDFNASIAVDCWISWVAAGMGGALIYDNKPLAYYRRHEGTFSSGDVGGLTRYRDWSRHLNRHCANIVNGIHDYRRLYRDNVSPDAKTFLDVFDSRNRLRKFFYPHRLRRRFLEEAAFRLLILAGKI